MNKMFLSTAKVAVLFTVSTFFAYMILKTQIKNSSKRAKSAVAVEQSNPALEEDLDTTEPVLTYVSSTKAETSDINLSVDDLDVTYFDSSKALSGADLEKVILSPSAFTQEKGKKKYVELEKEIEPKEFFHTSKAVLTTIAVEDVESEPVYFPTSKSAPIDIDLDMANDEAPGDPLPVKEAPDSLTKAEAIQLEIFELEDKIRKLKTKIAQLTKSGK